MSRGRSPDHGACADGARRAESVPARGVRRSSVVGTPGSLAAFAGELAAAAVVAVSPFPVPSAGANCALGGHVVDAARAPGVAAQQPPDGQAGADHGAVGAQRGDRVVAAAVG